MAKRTVAFIQSLIVTVFNYINQHYNYNLLHDEKLQHDLMIHLAAMLSRIKYNILTPNPLLADIKKYYPFAYDVTLTAITNSHPAFPNHISEDEIGYLAVHIGVALERNYNVGYKRQPDVLLVSDSGNATLRVIEAKIKREFPQINIIRNISLRDYELIDSINEDFIITTVRLSNKNKPIVKVAPFPTPYQLEQIGRLAMMDLTTPYILEHFFNEQFFMIIDEPITQQALLKQVCSQLKKSGYVNQDFYLSVIERESIVSTMLGENIALPHSLGLLAQKTVVATILCPKGISWGGEHANVIFLLAISKEEYEEAMTIYDLFVTFVKEKTTKRLLNSTNFSDFQLIVKDTLGRIG